MLKRIGAEEGGEFKAVASGTLPSGKPVVVNADGTVSVVAETTISENIGSATVFESGAIGGFSSIASTFDSSNNKVVLAYQDDDNSDYGTAIVGTVSGDSISFGSPTVFNAGATFEIHSTFDSSNNKVVICYKNDAATENGTAIVGTVSGTSISFGTAAEFETSDAAGQSIVFDSNSNRVVIIYRDGNNSNYGTAIVCTISGTSISFNTPVVFASTNLQRPGIGFDSTNNKIVVAYQDVGNSNKGTAIVGTISGTSISFGSSAVFDQGALGSVDPAVVYDTNAQKIVIVYQDEYDSYVGSAIVGTVSGTSISFGTAVVFESGTYSNGHACYDAAAQKIVIAYRDGNNSDYGTVIVGTVSGTSISFGSSSVFEAADSKLCSTVFDSNSNKVVISYSDVGNSSHGTSLVYQTAYVDQNLTSENYIGMSRGVAGTATQSEAVGSPTSIGFAGEPSTLTAAYDSSTGKVAISCKDGGNSNYGTTIIGTVSGTSISFGSPVVFNSETTNSTINVFDSSNNKIVTLYRNSSGHPHAKVGTISGTSISYGSAVQILGSSSNFFGATFDSTNNKVVTAYGGTTIAQATAVVGTVSGTSISFGSGVTTEGAYGGAMGFDSTNGKVVFALYTSSNGGRAYVGTVSGTSISFGSAVQFNSNISQIAGVAHDPNSGKTVIGYVKGGGEAAAIVGTVSGTSISFGSETEVQTSNTTNVGMGFDSRVNKVIYAYRYGPSPYSGRLRVGTVSGTSISFDSEVTFESGTTTNLSTTSIAFDSTEGVSVISYKDEGDSNTAKVTVFQASGSFVNRAEVASGQAASVDIIGSVSDNQSGLTAGQQYFVQTDGTIGTTAATPSVLAGTAISATELVVKT